jgi:hypothetical protein
MSTDPAVRDRAMGLVKAAYVSWISISPSMSGKDTQHQEYVARCKDLKALGLQATESEGKVVFAAVLKPVTEYPPHALVWPRGTGDTFSSEPRPLLDFTRLYTLESFLIGSSCCATKKRRQGGGHILCGSVPQDGLEFCEMHHKFCHSTCPGDPSLRVGRLPVRGRM